MLSGENNAMKGRALVGLGTGSCIVFRLNWESENRHRRNTKDYGLLLAAALSTSCRTCITLWEPRSIGIDLVHVCLYLVLLWLLFWIVFIAPSRHAHYIKLKIWSLSV